LASLFVQSDTSTKNRSVRTSLADAANLLKPRPDLAAEKARQFLAENPDHLGARLLLGTALRLKGNLAEAHTVLEPLSAVQPDNPQVLCELGLVQSALSDFQNAALSLSNAVALDPKNALAWRALGSARTEIGDTVGANEASIRHIELSLPHPQLVQAGIAMQLDDMDSAEKILREYIKKTPQAPIALRMLAKVASKQRLYDNAEGVLARCLGIAPDFDAARRDYAEVLYHLGRSAECVAQLDGLLRRDPFNVGYRLLRASALSQAGEHSQAVKIYDEVLLGQPGLPMFWVIYGDTTRAVGRTADSIAAYRKAISLRPSFGAAYWSLASLKTYSFSPEDIETMRTQSARTDISEEDRIHFAFALGKALEDIGKFEEAFVHYEKGNALSRNLTIRFEEDSTEFLNRAKAVFTPGFFASHSGSGSTAPDPIFIVGLPRSGSTLVEQILSSHSQVEGTAELPALFEMAVRLGGALDPNDPRAYPQVLTTLDRSRFRALGEEYLSRTRIQRKTDRPFFIDKLPVNFRQIGLIQLILPNAKIIDARRHPLATTLSCYTHYFVRAHRYATKQEDLGRYYSDYVALMTHYDAVLPGRVHRVIYENVVQDIESEVRKLLEYCGLPFEEGCLRYYENDRTVRTVSSEQVRLPIFKDGVDHWRNFEPWLGPLKEALGPVLDAYPDVPG